MNYLAHAYLSFNDPEVLVGNMISDFVKGKKKFDYPFRIQAGIMLHRLIDSFTDDHPATKEAKEFFRPDYRLYSGAFIDVVYDHFLATDETEFTETSLFNFSQTVYSILENYQDWLPERFASMFPYMRGQNWLFNYRTRWGTEKSFGGLVRRSLHLQESETAAYLFEKHYQPLQSCFRHFWKDAKPFIHRQYESLNG
ncbi:ACP phosphodiesterase [Terrimonas pollutisoli]|uniref:acyl carrier protein phosphodiesterase n=1 Tax=Terrimonas pollutisoli TaxID=3034147 RepID=UPI0023ED2381|nr:ACP phosphodiesterase [Terrimonas sp. H1YJ31]